MIRAIAAIDSKRGIAKQGKTPWDLPGERAHFRETVATHGGVVMMGPNTYRAIGRPIGQRNIVVSRNPDWHAAGVEAVSDARQFLANYSGDVWVVGGQAIFEQTMDLVDELWLTKVEGDYGCDKFFPPYESEFQLVKQSEPMTENGITYQLCIYKKL